jgi:sRNA-binding regulator protein Hfq
MKSNEFLLFSGSPQRRKSQARKSSMGKARIIRTVGYLTTIACALLLHSIAPNAAATSPATIDFNGDSKSDILWRNDSGAVAIWLMNGLTIQSTSLIATLGNDWHIESTVDFNGDSKSDILWRHNSGAVAIWLMNGLTIQSASLVGTVGNDWRIEATGDFNGDAKSDILWRHNSGAVAIWLMNGFTIQSASLIGTPGNDWHIVNTGDFNGDGKSDILWRHNSGAVAIWLMEVRLMGEGISIQSGSSIGTLENEWHIEATGDFNGDAKSDILWRHKSGAVAIWLMNGYTPQSASLIGTLGNDWYIAVDLNLE